MPIDLSEQLLLRIRGEYLEMPGLRLTRDQAQRLWAVDHATCAAALEMLVTLGFLTCGPSGHYKRRIDGSSARAVRMIKADLNSSTSTRPQTSGPPVAERKVR
jgi:hypothetical protein